MTGNLTARGIADLAATRCPRVERLGHAGLTPAQAAADLYGNPARPGSAFAFAEGIRFERTLVTRSAERLRALYAERLGDPAALTVLDLDGDIRAETGRALFDTAENAIRAHLDGSSAPDLVLHPPLRLSLPGRTEILRPDAIVKDGLGWRIVEIKSYLDKDGETDGQKVKSAVLQGAVAIVALRALLVSWGCSRNAAAARVSPYVDLVFQRAEWQQASLRPTSAIAEIEQIRAALNTVAARGLPTPLTADELLAVPHIYDATCEGRCALAEVCRGQAHNEEPNRAFFGGPGMADLALADVPLERASELARGAAPRTDAERLIAGPLHTGWRAGEGSSACP